MKKTTNSQDKSAAGDLVLQEVWDAKDTLSASYGHSLDKLFAQTRKREKRSHHRVVNLEKSTAAEVALGEPTEQDRRQKKSGG